MPNTQEATLNIQNKQNAIREEYIGIIVAIMGLLKHIVFKL